MYENGSNSKTLLVESVAAAKLPYHATPLLSWTDCLFYGILLMCSGGTLFEDNETDTPTIEELHLASLKPGKRALIVFDDFNNVQGDDILFIKHLFSIVKCQGVLAFLLVQDKGTANCLLKLNG